MKPTRRGTLIPVLLALAALACAGAIGSPAEAITVTLASTDVPKSIPNASLTGTSSVIIAPAIIISDINLILTDVTHTSVPDLHIELWSPTGTKVVLMRSFNDSIEPTAGILIHTHTPDNFINVTFDDQAPTSLANAISADNKSIIPGAYNLNHPSVVLNPLSQFNGQNSLGTWTLFIQDLADQDSGSIQNWSLQITGEPVNPPADIPEPATLLLLGSGLAALIGRSRR